jgi:hypothetical protein
VPDSNAPTKNRAPPHGFKKGQSGNPGGRPKGIRAAARELAGDNGEKMLAVLLEIATGKIRGSARDRKDAAVELLNRGFGRPIETSIQLEASDIAPDAVEVPTDVLAEVLTLAPDPQNFSGVKNQVLTPQKILEADPEGQAVSLATPEGDEPANPPDPAALLRESA